jgi:hypothetical protein
MFPSPQERSRLDQMSRNLHSGITPTQFGLEIERYHDLLENVAQVEKADTALPQAKLGMVRTMLRIMGEVLRRRVTPVFQLR